MTTSSLTTKYFPPVNLTICDPCSIIMPSPLIGGSIKRCFCLLRTSGVTREKKRPSKTKIGVEIAYITCDSDTTFKMCQGHQAALLSTALTHKAAVAVSVGTYSAWESTATLRQSARRCARR